METALSNTSTTILPSPQAASLNSAASANATSDQRKQKRTGEKLRPPLGGTVATTAIAGRQRPSPQEAALRTVSARHFGM